MTDATLWTIAVVLALVVTLVVAVLLIAIARTAKDIEKGAASVWTNGQRVANNTIHIPLLYRTNEAVETILERAGGILRSSRAIAAHAEECPGCPTCMLGGRS